MPYFTTRDNKNRFFLGFYLTQEIDRPQPPYILAHAPARLRLFTAPDLDNGLASFTLLLLVGFLRLKFIGLFAQLAYLRHCLILRLFIQRSK